MVNDIISTKRLILRPFTEDDFDTFYTYRNDSEIAKYQSWEFPFSEEIAKEFINEQKMKELSTHVEGWMQLAIELRKSKQMIGDCAINLFDKRRQAEFGITLAKSYQRRGYAVEVLNSLFKFLFHEMDIHRILGLVDFENKHSINLMQKLNMRMEAHYKQSYFDDRIGIWRDEFLFALLKDEI